jgi:hypothetical protein
MSSISASGLGQGLMQFLQQISSDAQSATTDAASSTAAATTTSTAASAAVDVPQAAGHHHRHHHGGTQIQKIQDAVTSALQSAQANGSATDPNKVIQTAIEQVLSGTNNVTPAGNPGTTATPNGGGAVQSPFEQTLQSYGVDPQQFRSDFLAAIKDAQGGQVNASNVFGNFPSGTQVDTTG